MPAGRHHGSGKASAPCTYCQGSVGTSAGAVDQSPRPWRAARRPAHWQVAPCKVAARGSTGRRRSGAAEAAALTAGPPAPRPVAGQRTADQPGTRGPRPGGGSRGPRTRGHRPVGHGARRLDSRRRAARCAVPDEPSVAGDLVADPAVAHRHQEHPGLDGRRPGPAAGGAYWPRGGGSGSSGGCARAGSSWPGCGRPRSGAAPPHGSWTTR